MTARRSLSIVSTLLAGLTACGATRAVAQEAGPQAPAAQDAGALNPMGAIEKTILKGFLEHPLFDPTRRLPPVVQEVPYVPPPPVAAPPEPPPNLQLIGVVHGARDMAFVHRDNSEKTIVLRTGDHVGGWIVTVRPPVGVRLRNGTRAFDYAMFAPLGAAVGPLAVDLEARPGGAREAVAAHDVP